MNKQIVKKEIEFAGKKLILETGEMAYLANAAVKATYGDTVLLVTAVSGDPNPELDYFPLTVNYEEKLYAGGLIKSSRFVKREGRPTDAAVITKRLIDHAIRPLFPDDYMDEVQIIATVLSLDDEADPEFLAMIATSAALQASDIPWRGPIVTVRVGYMDGEYILNPNRESIENGSDLDMMISFVSEDLKFMAVEAEINNLPEEKVLGAIEFARNNSEPLIKLINDFTKAVNPKNEKYEYESKALSEEILEDVSAIAKDQVVNFIKKELDKTVSLDIQEDILDEVLTTLEGKYKKSDMVRAFQEIEKKAIQHLILEEGKRPDGRGPEDIRPLDIKVGLLPRTHGSALFSRGVTQTLTVATLGSPSLELIIQDMYGEDTKRFIHYYYFPPYAGGTPGRIMGPKSRDIGHGMLAEKALRPVIPDQKEFPYMILLVSETLSSSGSSSMASACSSTLALMDAGVPIKDMVAGVGIGLISNDDFTKYKLLTDLAYMEDAFGFLDFKMTGTKTGVTAIQSDMKLDGIPMDLLPKIIEQSKTARLKILEDMEKIMDKPRDSVSEYAPKMVMMQIKPDQIGLVIGSGGKTIKEIQEKTQTDIYIDEEGNVVVSSHNKDNAQKAIEIIDGMTREIKVGEIFEGTVVGILEFGALIEILPSKVGLMHISEIADQYVDNVSEWVKEGDKVRVKVLSVSDDGKIGLSKKALEPGYEEKRDRRQNNRKGTHTKGKNKFRK